MTTVNDPDAIRIGTAERDDVVRILGAHFTEGRLPVDEYDERINVAVNAVTRRDVRALFVDLPPPYPAFMVPPTIAAPPLPAYPPPAPVHAYYPPPPDYYYSPKSKVVAGILQIFLPFGVGRFYTGHYGIAVAQLLTCGGFGIWTLIDGILLLVNGGTDGEGRRLRD
ncbi:TM2 domain-containing protein [Actinokineospora alba]|uniref:TM2 domain-containing protein n=1 Tax=Actinokineospora alba TaxID=504798 RepID=A0A1H0QJ79_9PSEU|nr:TM2 domain-containing protein [Actinokineospora alba]SDI29421.1 TM2 domain-containing protein [Actinokineospora alba]SDP17451.1 TM2 domain-containing protein [Actinokineospora alba]